MKTIAVLFAMLLGAFANAQVNNPGKINATVINVNGTEGKVIFGLHSEASFLKSAPEYFVKAEIKDGKATANFENIPPGTYALLAMHDKNDNGQMDFDAHGMPMESYGASGNALSYGPPVWAESKFEFEGAVTELEIRF